MFWEIMALFISVNNVSSERCVLYTEAHVPSGSVNKTIVSRFLKDSDGDVVG